MGTTFRSLRLGVSEVVAVASLLTLVVAVEVPRREARAQIDREASALATVRRIAAVEGAFRAAGTRDSNRDGKAEYGYLDELPLAADDGIRDAEGRLVRDGYRFEVQLPAGVVGGRTSLSRAGGRPDAVLAESSFFVSATPASRTDSGLRSFVLDAAGRLFVAEGVLDPDLRPGRTPPALVLQAPADDSLSGQPTWRVVEPSPKTGAAAKPR